MISWLQINRICVFTYEFALNVTDLDSKMIKCVHGYSSTVLWSLWNGFKMANDDVQSNVIKNIQNWINLVQYFLIGHWLVGNQNIRCISVQLVN